MEAKDLEHCVLQIEKLTGDRSHGNMVTLLSDLDKWPITAEQLETTDLVRALYRVLRRCSDSRTRRTVKTLLSKWKRQYSQERRGVTCREDGDGGDARAGSAQAGRSGVVKASAERAASATPASSDFPSVRAKCAQLLAAALQPQLPDQATAGQLAGDIEQHVYQLHKSSPLKYKACIRSKVANLKNPKNGHLRQGLQSGALSPGAFARMSAEEMAGAELRQLREQYSSQGVSERQLPRGVDGTQTQKIRCRRCGGSECSVTQVSRGALFLPAWVRRGGPDEDAMTFVTCGGCGQQWYHSGWVCL